MSASTIWTRVVLPGWHHWPEPTERRAYLGSRHRHQFGIRVEMPAAVDDARAVEFHDLMDEVREWWGDGERGASSCESMAHALASLMADRYSRAVTVTIDEDGEAGATVTVTP